MAPVSGSPRDSSYRYVIYVLKIIQDAVEHVYSSTSKFSTGRLKANLTDFF
eukprot:SAG31_NODE_1142_length_9696_cov_3.874232_10_plen_51_part_00